MRGCILEVNPEGLVRQSTLCRFTTLLILTWVVEIFLEKQGRQNKGDSLFWNRVLRYLLRSYITGWVKFHTGSVLFLGDKRINSFKKLSWSVPPSLNYWILLICLASGSESRKRYPLRILYMCLKRIVLKGFAWGNKGRRKLWHYQNPDIFWVVQPVPTGQNQLQMSRHERVHSKGVWFSIRL